MSPYEPWNSPQTVSPAEISRFRYDLIFEPSGQIIFLLPFVDPTQPNCVKYAATGVGLNQNHTVGFTLINGRASLRVSSMAYTQAMIAAASET